MAKFFRIQATGAPWGDYGSILQDGMTAHLGRNADGIAQLERTGPFIPPITFPGIGDVIVTARVREALESSGLSGISYLPVCKVRIARLDWHLWDRSAAEPAEYPESGEPEDYVIEAPHCAETAAALGVLWELRIEVGATEVRGGANNPCRDAILVRESSWTGNDFFRGTETAYNYVSNRARRWLEDNLPRTAKYTAVEVIP